MSNNPSSEWMKELLFLGSEITKSADFWTRLFLNSEVTMISGPTMDGFNFGVGDPRYRENSLNNFPITAGLTHSLTRGLQQFLFNKRSVDTRQTMDGRLDGEPEMRGE